MGRVKMGSIFPGMPRDGDMIGCRLRVIDGDDAKKKLFRKSDLDDGV